MKLYSDYTYSNISMSEDEGLKKALCNLINENIQIIIETGTFNGLGSTSFIYKAFKDSECLEKFYTMELNYTTFLKAKKNLNQFIKISCLYGCSTKLNEALDNIKNDEAIINHKNFPNIYIDEVENPVKFYSKELDGHLGTSEFKKILKKVFYPNIPKPDENLLEILIKNNLNKNLLIVLDSSGGMGLLEFNTVIQLLGNKDFFLLLDDTHHLKHFRSKEIIIKSNKFKIIYENNKHGSMLVKYVH